MPIFVILIIRVLTLGDFMGASLFLFFLLATATKLINVAFGFSLSQSANAIIYQSLPDALRRCIQTTTEGIVQPIAIAVADLSLMALTAGMKFIIPVCL